MMSEKLQIRDVFNPQVITALADDLAAAWPPFNHSHFLDWVLPPLSQLTYSERLRLITEGLTQTLPTDFPQAVQILLQVLPPPLGHHELSDTYNRFIVAPLTAYVSRHGLGHFDLSMQALHQMTQCLTAEWDIRPFIEQNPSQTLAVLQRWAHDPNHHVRRLVSEGTRPYLPWGKKLSMVEENPQLTLPLLELLRADPSEYVRRSVANHLNDLARRHPDLVVETLQRWTHEAPSREIHSLVKHATRTLVKKGHAGALRLLGVARGAQLAEVALQLATPTVRLGDYLVFEASLQTPASAPPQKLVIDYVLYFRKANGTLAPKVFKWSTQTLAPGATLTLSKRHSFRLITTRVYHPGLHALSIQVNGEESNRVEFELQG